MAAPPRSGSTDTGIPTGALMLYAAPTLPLSLVILPIGVVLPAFYDKYTTATLTAIGVASFAGRLVDAGVDPLIGYLSDRTRSRWGRRKPWLIVGAVLGAAALFQLFTPTPTSGIAYYATWSLLLWIAFAFIDIPLKAWGIELTRSYNERSRISTYVTAFTVLGSVAFWLALLVQEPFTGSTEINEDVFRGIAWTFVVAMPLVLALAVAFVPRGEEIATPDGSPRDLVHAVIRNKPLLRFIGAMMVWSTGNGIFTAVFFIFMTSYLLLGPQFPYLMLCYFGFQMLSMPLWLKLIYRFGKHRSWSASWALNALLPAIVLTFEPGASAFLPALALTAVIGIVAGGSLVVPMALLGDIVDYDLLKTGVNRAGNYFAFQTFLWKFSMGVGVGVGLPLLAAFGYESGVAIEGTVKLGLIFTYLVLPAACGLTAAAIVWNFPLDAHKHAVIRKRLAQRATRAAGAVNGAAE